ncbi:MAG: ABC transporter substrate-binding protein [Eubacteriales bacterium]|nr:ABC transporter substrate-binding protein [Eubacteriales bacterium]
MKFKKLLSLGLVLTLSICALSACSQSASSGSASGKKVIKIGIFEPATGENGGGGKQEADGVLYANEQMPTIEINGETYDIEIVNLDNKSDKTEAVNVANKFISEKVSCVIGSYGSGVSIAAGPIFEEAKIPAIGGSCTNPQVTEGNEYYFRVCFLDPFQGTVMANFAKQNGYKKAAVLTQLGDDYSEGLGSYFKTAFKSASLGGEIVAEEKFQTNATDFKAQLTNIKNSNADFIFAPSSITTAPLIIKQARELGINAKIGAGDTWENGTIIDNAGKSAEGVVFSTFYDENDVNATAEAKSFVPGFKEYLKKTNQPDIIPAVSALGYDAYLAAYKAIEKAQSTNGEKIKDALKTISFDGVTGHISFDETGDAVKNTAYIKEINNGQFKFLTTTTIG